MYENMSMNEIKSTRYHVDTNKLLYLAKYEHLYFQNAQKVVKIENKNGQNGRVEDLSPIYLSVTYSEWVTLPYFLTLP